MNRHDIVVLSEIHCAKVNHAPGFIPIVAKNISPNHRGGLAVLFKYSIYSEVYNIDKSVPEQLWFKLRSVPGVQFCGAYVAPSESRYFNESSLPELQAKSTSEDTSYIIVGDLNARCGTQVHQIAQQLPEVRYTPVDTVVNSNGREVTQICIDNSLLLLNNVESGKQFPGGLTFRRKTKWISELDLCLLSKDLLHYTKCLEVVQDTDYPSDHAPVSVEFAFTPDLIHPRNLLTRAESMSGHAVLLSDAYNPSLCRKAIPSHVICPLQFSEQLDDMEPPAIAEDTSVDALCEEFSDTIYKCASTSKKPPPDTSTAQPHLSRWQRIIDCDDPKVLWRAIDWKGEFNPAPEKDKPSDLEFQAHIERLLNPEDLRDTEWPVVSDNHVSIPVLDDPIDARETSDAISKQMKPGKQAGPDGNSPGTFHMLPAVWIVFLTSLLNLVFRCSYPVAWTKAKLSMLFKKGDSMDTGNYRGISVIDSIAKLYDYIMNNRLMKWYTPQREQAGGQAKRSCIEHILTLCLWIRYCKRRRCKLFIAFIDFSKAYDRVPRGKLFRLLMSLGCGSVMLCALMSMYSLTTCVLGTVLITCTLGVRQGSPTSVFLFIIYVDTLIKMVKEKSPCDGFLSWLHLLMLMDDTVILATSRKSLEKKLSILKDYCDEYGMQINEKKTEFMVVNGSARDRETIVIQGMTVKHCTKYVYLGVTISENGSAATMLKDHVADKKKHLNRLIIFLSRNHDAPFFVKRKVFNAAFSSAILYGCEAWLDVSLKPLETMYMSAVRRLLDVRQSTPTLTCLIEAGIPSLAVLVKHRQSKFLQGMFEQRRELEDTDPLMHTLKFMRQNNPALYTHIDALMELDLKTDLKADQEKLCNQLRGSPPDRTKLRLYLSMNPELSIHPLYEVTDSEHTFEDNLRITFSRIRLCSHKLRSETGRWNGTPSDQRFCPHCTGDSIQDEEHILQCPATLDIRSRFNVTTTNIHDILESPSKSDLSCLKNCLKLLQSNNRSE